MPEIFMPETKEVIHLKDLWSEEEAGKLNNNQLALLRYRSNLLGADLRITNFGGGNTSSKFELPDPFSGAPVRVLAVKGSGGISVPSPNQDSRSFTWSVSNNSRISSFSSIPST